MHLKNSFLILVGVIFLFAFRFVNAAPGDLDLSFGTNGTGMVTTQIKHTDGTYGYAVANASVIQPDDKIIAVGSVLPSQYDFYNPNYDIVLARYNADGTLDTGFGNAGKVVASYNTSSSEEAYAVALQPDGKILVGGYIIATQTFTGTRRLFALWRFNSNGTPDYSFGISGRTITEGFLKDYQQSQATIRGLVVQPDGKIFAVGYDKFLNLAHVVIRFHPNGAIDTSLNNGSLGGKYYFNFGNYETGALSAAQQSDGEIVIGGSVNYSKRNNTQEFAAVRFNSLYSSAGTIDSVTFTNFPGFYVNLSFAIAVQADDKFVLAGRTFNSLSFSNYALARYNADGTLDESFGNLGRATADIAGNEDWARGVTIQTDGKIVAAGYSVISSRKHFSLARFNEDGSIDESFGILGKVTTSFEYESDAYSVNTQSDGKIVVVGNTRNVFALARYEN